MNHPELILRVLDKHLVRPARLILYGRAALALGYPGPRPAFESTMDVDAILPEVEMAAIEDDDSFWDAIGRTNDELAPTGLYLTHLFMDSQVILRPDWLRHLVEIPLGGLVHLKLFRPATGDLVLTKMMRVDPQDREDLEFLLSHSSLDSGGIRDLAGQARIPNIPEIREAFEANLRWLSGRFDSSGK